MDYLASKSDLCTKFDPCFCGFCFSIHHAPFGVIMSAKIPVKDACSIMNYYSEEYGYDIYDAAIAQHFDAALCLTTQELSQQWRQELGIE